MSRRTYRTTFAILLAGTLAIGIPLGFENSDMRDRYDYAFGDLQDARTEDKAQTILDTWTRKGGNEAIERTMRWDLAFPLFYAPLLALIAYGVALRRPTRWVRVLGYFCAGAALVGGLADVGENLMMIYCMLGRTNGGEHLPVMLSYTYPKLAGAATAVSYAVLANFDRR